MRNFTLGIAAVVALALLPPAPAGAQTSPDAMLDSLQHASFEFFWDEANPVNGLIRDRSQAASPASIASTGFGLSAIAVGIDHGWVERAAGADRVERTLLTFWRGPQGQGDGYIGYKGLFYHFLDLFTATRTWSSELSSIDSALLLAGILDAKQYFSADDPVELHIRQLADSIYYRMDWQWMQNGTQGIMMGWQPGTQFANYGYWTGYNEAMIMYILALGTPTFYATSNCWSTWLSGYHYQTWYGYTYVNFPPLFGHQYSHCWVDFRNIKDAFGRFYGPTYFENSRRATYAQQAYCIANPGGWTGYGELMWGLTACDGYSTGPHGYNARGAPPAQNDDGVIAPTAPAGSIAFAPEIVIPTLLNMWDNYPQTRMKYGFRDAFSLAQNWFDSDVIGIDEGPIVLMIENYRNGSVWARFMQNADVQNGLARALFLPTTDAGPGGPATACELLQSDPNPCRGRAVIGYRLALAGPVRLALYDVRGRHVATLVSGTQPAGVHQATLAATQLASGVYHYRLEFPGGSLTKKLVVLRQ
jgi:hypothetical protein